MPKRSSTKRDDELANLLASKIATSEDEPLPEDIRHLLAVALGRRGGLKGGRARAEKLSAEERSEIAKKAAQARWKDRSQE
jgi:hypothetical protein